MFAVRSRNPSAPGQWECAAGIVRSLEAGGSRHPSVLGQAVALRHLPHPRIHSREVHYASKIRVGCLQSSFGKQNYSPAPEQTEE